MINEHFIEVKNKIMVVINSIIKPVLTFIYITLGIVTLHWTINYVYNKFCIDYSYYGFIMHIFNMSSPFCQFINFIQFKISKNYVDLWLSAGIAFIAFIASKTAYSQSSRSLSSSVSE